MRVVVYMSGLYRKWRTDRQERESPCRRWMRTVAAVSGLYRKWRTDGKGRESPYRRWMRIVAAINGLYRNGELMEERATVMDKL